MKLGIRTNVETGHTTVEKTTRKKGGDEISRESHTEGIGPLTRNTVHARVGANVSTTLSRNYHSVMVGVTVNVPVDIENIDDGLDWVFRRANKILNKELKNANSALDALGKRNRDD